MGKKVITYFNNCFFIAVDEKSVYDAITEGQTETQDFSLENDVSS